MTNPSQNVGNQRSISSRSYHKNFESAEAIEMGSPSCKELEISTEHIQSSNPRLRFCIPTIGSDLCVSRNKIAAMVKEGKTVEQIKSALPDAPAPGAPPRGAGAPSGAPRGAGAPAAGGAGGGRGGAAPAALTFVETAYQEIT